MDSAATISIILPFKNEEKYIAECLESILNQTYTHWELLAIDDHSSDAGTEIVREFEKRDSRIRYLKNPGTGVIDALSNGLEHSAGSLITRMDADDIKHRDNLESLIAIWRKGFIAIGLVKYFREGGLGDGYQQYESWINQINSSGLTWEEVYRECVIPSPCWLVHREDLAAVGGFRSRFYPEDYDLCFRFYHFGLHPVCTDKVIHYWRDHAIRTTRVSQHYSDNQFTKLKIHYFLEIDYNSEKPLVLLGAGDRAKKVAGLLCQAGVQFRWLTNNQKKVGHNIYGVILESNVGYHPGKSEQVLVAISNFTWTIDPSLGSKTNSRIFYLC